MKKKRLFLKILISFFAVILLCVFVVIGIFFNEIGTILSIRKIADGNEEHYDGAVYTVKYKGGYYFDDFLEQGGASSDSEVMDFIINNITKGIEIPGVVDSGCSSFTCATEDGDRLFCRNYDLSKAKIALVYTKPKNDRYSSISTVNLEYCGISVDTEKLSMLDRLKFLATPYATMDGMNEKGVTCSIYVTMQGRKVDEDGYYRYYKTDVQTEKPDLTSTTMLRMILDYASSVDEAIELVKKYDLHDSSMFSFHYTVSDASGKSACLEWIYGTDDTDTDGTKRELNVFYSDGTNPQVVTNFIIAPNYYATDEDKYGLDRYNTIIESLNNTGNVVDDENEALNILKSVGGRKILDDKEYEYDCGDLTLWSVVYNMTDKTITLVANERFGDKEYTFNYSFKDFFR